MRISLWSNSDQHEIYPYSINALENRVVMRIEGIIREDESNWYFNKFSPRLLLINYRDSKWESQFDFKVSPEAKYIFQLFQVNIKLNFYEHKPSQQ